MEWNKLCLRKKGHPPNARRKEFVIMENESVLKGGCSFL